MIGAQEAQIRPPAGNGRPLGNHAKSAAAPGPGSARSTAGTVHDSGQERRWRLQRKVQQIMADKRDKVDSFGHPVQAFRYRVAMCHRGTDGGPVEIRRSPDQQRARYDGLQTCGSVWHCPICAPKVANTRRDEMNLAIHAWLSGSRGEQGHVYFLTYTHQHGTEDAGAGCLQDRIGQFAQALSAFKGSRAYRQIMADAGTKGLIRALEVTYGEINGWHAHTHELLFAAHGLLHLRGTQPIYWRSFLGRLRRAWARVLISRGLSGLRPGDVGVEKFKRMRSLLRHALTIQPGTYAAEYVAKFGREPESDRGCWGIGSEMTRAHLKQGRAPADGVPQRCGHATPWGLLNDAMDGDQRSVELFREYALAFQGRRQLYWSPGLKAFFELGDVGDEDLAAAPDVRCTEYVIQLTPGQWSRVLSHNARFDVLRVAAIHGRAGVLDFLDALDKVPRTHSGEFAENRSYFVPQKAA